MYCKMTMKKILAILSLLVMLVVSMPMASADTTMDLEIPQGTSWGTWQKVSTRRMSFKFEVKNTSSYKTVRSFDVTYYTCDAYGNQNSPTQTVTLEQKIKPYEEVETGLIYLDNPDDICLVFVALSRVRYTNGTSETDSDLDYAYWILDEEELMCDPADIVSGASTTNTTTTTTSTGSGTINVQELFDALRNSNGLLNTNTPSSSVSLEILNHDEVICKRVSTKRYAFQFKVKNTNTSKTVKSYDVSYYTCDEYGNQNSPTETVTLTQKIKAYETIMSDIVYLMNPDSVYRAYFAITRVRYTDGTSESTSSPDYCYWYWDK